MKTFELRLVVKVKAKSGFQLECTFDNGVTKTYDMSFVSTTRAPMLTPFKDEKFFKKVFLEMGTPKWPNGYDICADLLFKDGTLIEKKRKVS